MIWEKRGDILGLTLQDFPGLRKVSKTIGFCLKIVKEKLLSYPGRFTVWGNDWPHSIISTGRNENMGFAVREICYYCHHHPCKQYKQMESPNILIDGWYEGILFHFIYSAIILQVNDLISWVLVFFVTATGVQVDGFGWLKSTLKESQHLCWL